MWKFPSELYNLKPSAGSIVGGLPTLIKVPAVSLVDRVIASAKSIVGQRELPGNSGFKDPKFQERMKAAGWNKFAAWCVYTVEDIWDNAMGPGHPLLPVTEKLFSGSATATWANYVQSDKFKTGQVPKLGSIVIWRLGKGWQGHAAVVIEVPGKGSTLKANEFLAVEGNGSVQGSREGIEVVKKVRKIGEPFKPSGLNLLGFIYLPE